MKTFISKISPPTEEFRIVLTMQRRDGERIDYVCGSYGNEHDMKAELGGCQFCISIVWCEINGKTRWGASHPRFHRNYTRPCESCRPKLERLDEIDRLIFALQKEKTELE